MHPSKTVFISAGIGLWYSTGAERFKGSLIQFGAPADCKIWVNDWPPAKIAREPIYNIKAVAFEWALNQGYETIIWADASVWAITPVNRFLDDLARKGYWLGQSGHRASQTCSDACLQYFGIDRDQADKIHDCATGLFGVNVNHAAPRRFIERFIKAGHDGAFAGSRKHGGQSKDPRFLFHRQDQSAATIIASQEGLALDLWQTAVAFAWDAVKPCHTFKCQGM